MTDTNNKWGDLVAAANKPGYVPRRVQVAHERAEKKSGEVKTTKKPHYDNYVTEKNFEHVRMMFHDLLFGGVLKDTEQRILKPWYHVFVERSKLSQKQMGVLSALWTKYKTPKELKEGEVAEATVEDRAATFGWKVK